LKVQERLCKSVLSRSGIGGIEYCINPYVGCSHGCRYCYATFMKRFTGHREPWGSFVDVKINAPEVLRNQIRKASKGVVMVSSVTDPYQAIEGRYGMTRQCLEVLLEYQFPVHILTKSPLILRDLDLIRSFKDIEVGLTITTDREDIKEIFEPYAPAIEARIQALKTLFESGIRTYAFIGPLLPADPEKLSAKINPYAHEILIDRMNYVSKTLKIYKSQNLKRWLDEGFNEGIIASLQKGFGERCLRIC